MLIFRMPSFCKLSLFFAALSLTLVSFCHGSRLRAGNREREYLYLVKNLLKF
jgi:hypothetical protein